MSTAASSQSLSSDHLNRRHPGAGLLRAVQPQLNLPLAVLLVLSIIPFAIMVSLSLKSVSQYEYERWSLSLPLHWINYTQAWGIVRVYITNSVVTSTLSALGVCVLSALGGYAFARGNFRGKDALFLFVLSGMMIPGILYLVPKFILFKDLGLINTRWALLISYWTEGQIFGIFLFRSHFEAMPDGLFEAAQIDGASIWDQFRHVAMPLSTPILCTLAVMNVLFTWNDLIWPWIAISEERLRTISIGMSIFQRTFSQNWGPMFAGFTLASVPLIALFAFTSKYFIKGLTSGAFKA